MLVTDVIGPAIGLIGVIVSIYLWRRARVRKAISYRLTSLQVVSVHRDAQDRISVLYDDEPVSDARIVDLRVTNTGNADIHASDFEEPFSLFLGESARVLSDPQVGKSQPPELHPKVNTVDGALVVAPLLLNRGDSFQVSALVSDVSGDLRLRARIAGIAHMAMISAPPSESPTTRPVPATAKLAAAVSLIALLGTAGSVLVRDVTSEPRGSGYREDAAHVRLGSGGELCGEFVKLAAPRGGTTGAGRKRPHVLFLRPYDLGAPLVSVPVSNISQITMSPGCPGSNAGSTARRP